ncbi:hypothetical protein BDV25DRAFT_22754 [Aspergillus avenaceus]|uniref:Uncharacterized protein n=1 Tax=Aspergillus avenaceus TaxID=36643 RepID=A0A5N6TP54_ASPAV|nr:hypothetical protein BDV25DRAFT_22754 [Aspergillus avenaceus]
MHLSLPSFLLLLTPVIATAQSSATIQDALRPRNWDIRLLKKGCNPDSANFDLSLFHAQGLNEQTCDDLSTARLNFSAVDTVSWKSPGTTSYDLCMYADGGCSANVGEIRGGWGVCVPFSGWRGWKVVGKDEEC